MFTRNKVLSNAVDECIKELYSFVQPSIDWDEFVKENKIYSERYKKWEKERNSNPEFIGKSITECIGPRPYEFYYLPKDIMKDICDSYVHAYRMDIKQEFLDNIKVLKDYCKKPIVDKWIEGENGFPGHRGYEHPDNLEKEINKLLCKQFNSPELSGISNKVQDKFFEFLDMAGNFFEWNSDLNSFNVSVYLGPSPNSNKQAVIENWKKYRNQDIKINEKEIKENYYGEELD